MSRWTCLCCTFENLDSRATCEMCATSKPATETLASDEWVCPACTCNNPCGEQVCLICTTPAPAHIIASLNRDTWMCGACTARNPNSALACVACESPSPTVLASATETEEEAKAPAPKSTKANITKQVAAATYSIEEKTWDDSKCRSMQGDYAMACIRAKGNDNVVGAADVETRNRLHTVITRLYADLNVQRTGDLSDEKQKASEVSACTCCFDEFDFDTNPRFVLRSCGHGDICKTCVAQHLKTKIGADQVMPWLRCPHPQCNLPIDARDLYSCDALLKTSEWALFAATLLRCNFARNEHFRVCPTSKCLYGFMLAQDKVHEKHVCPSCCVQHSIKLNDLSPEFQAMIADGSMRTCPRCKQLTTKERGVCSIITCVTCNIVWNWQTRETGKDEATLKAKARADGSLWMPGELAWQQNLERTDLPAFKQLLERNGIKYKPGYQRGT